MNLNLLTFKNPSDSLVRVSLLLVCDNIALPNKFHPTPSTQSPFNNNFFPGNTRPKHLTRGKGGVIAQLQGISDMLRPDLCEGSTVQSKTQEIPPKVPINNMAPPTKQQCGVGIYVI